MGGYSSEVEISLKSGEVVYDSLDKTLYNPYRVHVLKDKWVLVNDDGEYAISKEDFSATVNGKKSNLIVFFNAIHGTPGEDGQLLAYLELLGIPHTSAPFYQMALTFNKRDTLSVARQYGIKTAKSVYFE